MNSEPRRHAWTTTLIMLLGAAGYGMVFVGCLLNTRAMWNWAGFLGVALFGLIGLITLGFLSSAWYFSPINDRRLRRKLGL